MTSVVLPARRSSTTYAPRVVGPEGAHRVHVTVGHADGAIVEVWIDVQHREGAPLVGTHHALARLASLSLQAGVELDTVVRALRGVGGGPEGEVTECDGLAVDAERGCAWATSPADLVAQVLELAAREVA